jgi:hypothetical protein
VAGAFDRVIENESSDDGAPFRSLSFTMTSKRHIGDVELSPVGQVFRPFGVGEDVTQ